MQENSKEYLWTHQVQWKPTCNILSSLINRQDYQIIWKHWVDLQYHILRIFWGYERGEEWWPLSDDGTKRLLAIYQRELRQESRSIKNINSKNLKQDRQSWLYWIRVIQDDFWELQSWWIYLPVQNSQTDR